jgi:hypothetical protein
MSSLTATDRDAISAGEVRGVPVVDRLVVMVVEVMAVARTEVWSLSSPGAGRASRLSASPVDPPSCGRYRPERRRERGTNPNK